MISTVEFRRIVSEWRIRLQRIQDIIHPPRWDEANWKQFGRALVGLLQKHGTTWTVDPKTYWDLRWKLRDGGELICQLESTPEQKLSVVVAQTGGFIDGTNSYTWFWAEFDHAGEFLRDPYWVEGTWRDALATLLLPYQHQAGYFLAGTAPTPPALMLGDETPPVEQDAEETSTASNDIETSDSATMMA